MPDCVYVHHGGELTPPAELAVAELVRFLRRHTGRAVRRCPSLSSAVALAATRSPKAATPATAARLRDDGYAISPHGAGVAITARNAKGLLNGVYGYLALSGMRWPKPGVELWPPAGDLPVPRSPVVRNPAFPRRGVIHTVHQDWRQWCQWYARLGFNEVLLHLTPSQWGAARRVAEEHGVGLQVGGHGLSKLVPRALFNDHPDYFRALQPPDFDRTRLADTNLCSSSPEALARVRQGARRYARQYPGASVYHLWPDDLPAGGWCYCARCWGYPPQDQTVFASNAAAEGITDVASDAKLAYVVYHDTLEAPRLARPHPALTPLYAPRERCYAHAVNDPTCRRNRHFRENLERVLDYFGHSDWSLFEYYSDAILFRAMLPVIPEVIAQDLRYYHSLGLGCAQHLVVGATPGLLINTHIFARQAWEVAADPWDTPRELARGVPGLLGAWKARAKASLRWLAICEWPLDRYFDYRFLTELDDRTTAAYRKQLGRAAAGLEAAAASLSSGLPAWAANEETALASSAAICRQMDAHMAMLHALRRYVNGAGSAADARGAYADTMSRSREAGRVLNRAGHGGAYFHELMGLLEPIWRDKLGVLRRAPVATPRRRRR